jgi:hypothetical protein
MLLVLMTAVQPGVEAAQQGAKPGAAGQGADGTAPSRPPQAPEDEARIAYIATLNDKTPLQVQVVVSRYQGDKRISSMPYMLSVNAVGSHEPLGRGENSQLRMGAEVPIVLTTQPGADSQNQNPVTSVQYRSTGTNIDCRARSMGDGRFELGVSVQDTSVFTDTDAAAVARAGQPVFRSFQASHTLILRDGESRQFTAATDRVTGEVVRIDVTLTAVK